MAMVSQNNILSLRPITSADLDLVLKMRNQDWVRSSMIHQEIISADQHKKWFDETLKDSTKAYFIFDIDGIPAGVIGFYDLSENDFANWSFYLGSEKAPKGSGSKMCAMGLDHIFGKINISGIKTNILHENTASIRLHEKLGFKPAEHQSQHGIIQFYIPRAAWRQK